MGRNEPLTQFFKGQSGKLFRKTHTTWSAKGSTMSCLGKLKAVTTTGKVAGGEWGQCMFSDIHVLEMLDSSLRFVILCRTISTNKVLCIHVLLMEEWHSWGNFLNEKMFARSITVCIIFNPSESIFPLLFYIIISSAEYWCYFLPKSMNRCYIINASYLAVWVGFLDNFFRPISLCLEMFLDQYISVCRYISVFITPSTSLTYSCSPSFSAPSLSLNCREQKHIASHLLILSLAWHHQFTCLHLDLWFIAMFWEWNFNPSNSVF